MNSFEALVLFIGAVVAVALAVYVLQSQVIVATSVVGKGGSAAVSAASHAFQITSVYGDASDTNIVVRAVSGDFDLNSAIVYVNDVPHRPVSAHVVGGTARYLSPGQTGIIVVSAPFSDSSCYVVDMGGDRELWGVCT